MAHLDPLDRATLGALDEHFRERYDETIGFTPNSLLTMARRPEIVTALGDLITTIWRTGTVPAGLKALVGLVSSTSAGRRRARPWRLGREGRRSLVVRDEPALQRCRTRGAAVRARRRARPERGHREALRRATRALRRRRDRRAARDDRPLRLPQPLERQRRDRPRAGAVRVRGRAPGTRGVGTGEAPLRRVESRP